MKSPGTQAVTRELRRELAALRARLRLAQHAEESLRDSEARLRAILNTMVDAVITIDTHGIIYAFNPAAERMFGHTAAQIIGRSVNELMPSPYNRNHDRYLARYMKTGEARIIGIGREVVGKRRDGSTFPMELAVSEVRLGKKLYFTGIVHDITNRKKTEEVITSISEKERQRFGQELHDSLGQQLTGIALLMKSLENKLARSDKATRARALDISELVARVLEETKLQAHGLYPIELERHGLSAALIELAYIQERLFGVACKFEGPVTMPELQTHEALHLYRIVQEAVNNAIKHGRAKHIRVKLARDDEMLQLVIEDDGSGLPEKAGEKGGMGLSIMRYRASMLGAKMQFHRGTRCGTVVTCLWYMPDRSDRPEAKKDEHGSQR